MAKEQPPKRSIADLLSGPAPQTEPHPLTEAEIEAATRKIHYTQNTAPAAPVAVAEEPKQLGNSESAPANTQSPPAQKAGTDDALTRISFDVTISMFVKMKEKALRNHQTMRGYLTKLVEKDLDLQ